MPDPRRTHDVSPDDDFLAKHFNDMRKENKGTAYFDARERDPADLKLNISEGVAYIGGTRIAIDAQESPEFTAPTTNDRIDILILKDDGTIERLEGTEATTPTAPEIAANKMPLWQIYNRSGQSSIKEEDDGTNGYIEKDLRPFMVKHDVKVEVFDTPGSHTWTKPAGLRYAEVEVVGGGGGGSGNIVGSRDDASNGENSSFKNVVALGGEGGKGRLQSASNAQNGLVAGNGGLPGTGSGGTNSSDIITGSPGYGGQIKKELLLADDLDATETVVVGSGGSGASGYNADGGDGGNGVVIVTEYY